MSQSDDGQTKIVVKVALKNWISGTKMFHKTFHRNASKLLAKTSECYNIYLEKWKLPRRAAGKGLMQQ